MANVAGKWKLEKVENMDAFMKVLGAPEELIKKALDSKDKHVIEIEHNGNKWNIKSDTMKMNHEFELGKEVEQTGPWTGGKKTKSVTTLSGDKLITDCKLEDGKAIHIERWIEGDHLIMTMKHGDHTTRHEFVKA